MHTVTIPVSVLLLSAACLGLAGTCLWLLWSRNQPIRVPSENQSPADLDIYRLQKLPRGGARTIDIERHDGSVAISIKDISRSWMRPDTWRAKEIVSNPEADLAQRLYMIPELIKIGALAAFSRGFIE